MRLHHARMDDRAVGSLFRSVRIRGRMRQEDVAKQSGLARSIVSLIERGSLERVSLASLRRVGDVLDIRVQIDSWWRSGDADRLRDRAHAALVDRVVRELRAAGWVVRVEVTFNHFGERGSADIVAWHPDERILLIVEVKSGIGDMQELASTFERKVRILPDVLAKEGGWHAATVARVLVVADTMTNRRVVAAHAATLASIWPARTARVRAWIRRRDAIGPADGRRGFGGIWFLRLDGPAGRSLVARVRPSRPPAP